MASSYICAGFETLATIVNNFILKKVNIEIILQELTFPSFSAKHVISFYILLDRTLVG